MEFSPRAKRCKLSELSDVSDLPDGVCSRVVLTFEDGAPAAEFSRASLSSASGFFEGLLHDDDMEEETCVHVDADLVPLSANITPEARNLLPHALRWLSNALSCAITPDAATPWLFKAKPSDETLYAARHLLTLAHFLLCNKIRDEVFRWLELCDRKYLQTFFFPYLLNWDVNSSSYRMVNFIEEAPASLCCDALDALPVSEASHFSTHVVVLLKHESSAVRAAAVRTLGRFGPTDEDSFASNMASLVRDESVDVRQAVARAFGKFGSAATPHLASFASLLRDDDDSVQDEAVNSLGALGSLAAEATMGELRKHDWRICKAVGRSLGKIGTAALSHVEPMLRHESAHVRRAGALAVRDMGSEASPCLEHVVALLSDSDDKVCEQAVLALGALGEVAAPFINRLLRLKDDADEWIRVAVAVSLGAMGAAAKYHAKDLMSMFTDSSWQVRRAAVKAFVRLWNSGGVPHEDVDVGKVAVLLNDDFIDIVEEAIVALAAIGGAAVSSHIPQMASILLEPDIRDDVIRKAFEGLVVKESNACLRETVAASLASIGASASTLAPLMAKLLHDSDNHVREEACKALLAMGAPVASLYADDIALLLQDPFRVVRAAAAKALGSFGSPAASHIGALSKLLEDDSKVVRVAAAQALQNVDGYCSKP